MTKEVALVSACLLGVPTRYDADSKPCQEVIALQDEYILVPFCPEQLGGLATPRKPAEILGDKVLNSEGLDVTANFMRGAMLSLQIAKDLNPDIVILKESSPSCGVRNIYDGTFSGNKVPGEGLTAKFLKQHFRVISENELGTI